MSASSANPKGESMSAVKVLLSVLSVAALTACQDASQGLSKFSSDVSEVLKQRYGVATDDPQAGTTFYKSSKLYGLLKSAPFDPNRAFSEQYPRVALAVHQSPPNHTEVDPQFLGIQNKGLRGCYRVSAVIWSSKTKSEQIEPFAWCAPRDVAYNVPCRSYSDWVGRNGFYPNDENTGATRTDGPVPPLYALPTEMEATGGTYRDSMTFDGALVCTLLHDIGIDPQWGRDRRVWLKAGPKLTP